MNFDGTAKRVYRAAQGFLDSRRRDRIVFKSRSGRPTRPTVYFLTPDFAVPSGGIMVIYRHVDILNSAGLNAFVLHHRRGFRCTWFENQTAVTNIGDAVLREDDVVVLSELDVDILARLPVGVKGVIFNQNAHLTWSRPAAEVRSAYGDESRLAAVAVVSEHNKSLLQGSFPRVPVRRIRLSIDPALFHPGTGDRPQRIGYMPRRSRDDARQVVSLLESQRDLGAWKIVALDGLSHRAVADALRQVRIFLAFTHQEGFGLPAAEAMACGAYVIGNHGFGGREFFDPRFSTPIENGDILGFADTLKHALAQESATPNWCRERGNDASSFVLGWYTREREREDVVALYGEAIEN